MGASTSKSVISTLFGPECNGDCFYDSDISLKARMAQYERDAAIDWENQAPVGIRLELRTPLFYDKPAVLAEVAHALHDHFHPSIVFYAPREIVLVFLKGSLQYGTMVDRVCSMFASYTAGLLAIKVQAVVQVSCRLVTFPQPTTPDCRCHLWEVYNYLVCRSQAANHQLLLLMANRHLGPELMHGKTGTDLDRALMETVPAVLPAVPDVARYGSVMVEGVWISMPARWWELSSWKNIEWLQGQRQHGVDYGYLLSEVSSTELDDSHVRRIVDHCSPGCSLNLADQRVVTTASLVKLCDAFLASLVVPRNINLSGTSVSGDILTRPCFWKLLQHPGLAWVDLRGSNFAADADHEYLQKLVLQGKLSKVVFWTTPAELQTFSQEAQDVLRNTAACCPQIL